MKHPPPIHARIRRRTTRRGFTLAEVLAALVLMGIVLPIALKGVSLALAASDDARRKIEATALAENKLAEFTAANATGVSAGGMSGDFGTDWPAYQWEASNVMRDVELNEITIRVVWTARGRQRNVAVSTLVYTGTGSSTGSRTSTASATGGAP